MIKRRTWIALATAIGFFTLPASAVFAATGNTVPTPDLMPASFTVNPSRILPGSREVNTIPESTPWTFGVILPSQNLSGLLTFSRAVSNPQSPSYHHFLSHSALMRQFGPLPAVAEQLTGYLDQQGFRVSQTGQMLEVTGSVGQVDKLFGTHMGTFAKGDQHFEAPTSAIHIPSELRTGWGLTNLVAHTLQPQMPTTLPSSHAAHYAPLTAMAQAPHGLSSSVSSNGMTATAQLISNGPRDPGMAVRYLVTVTNNGQPDVNAYPSQLSGPFSGANPFWGTDFNGNGQFIIDYTVSQPQNLSMALTVTDNINTVTLQLPTATFNGPRVATTTVGSLFGPGASGTMVAPWNPQSNSVVTALHADALVSAAAEAGTPTIGVFTAGNVASVSQQDVDTFASQFGLPAPNVTVAYQGPNACSPGEGCGMLGIEGELSLDMQMMESASPGTNIQVFEAGSFHTALNQVVTQDEVSVFSISYGEGEQVLAPNEQATFDGLAAMANAEGITISVSAGDSGGYEGAEEGMNSPMPSYPANSPDVSSLGGTEDAVTPFGQISQVAMWGGNIGGELSTPTLLSFLSEQNMIAGGGFSTIEPTPSYQLPFVSASSGRGNPDFSLPASVITPGYFFYYPTQEAAAVPGLVGGTSASAPLFAGFVADLTEATHTRFGNINPLIYQTDMTNPLIMTPVAYGNNGAYAVTPRYNAVTGLGQLNVGALYQTLQTSNLAPVIQTVTPYLSTPGSTVFIRGRNFGSAQGTVTFTPTVAGTPVPAMVEYWSPTYIAVTVPNSPPGQATVTVTASDGLSATSTNFSIEPPPIPVISTLYPNTAPAGAMIRIYGMNFGSTAGSVTIGGLPASVDQWTPYYLGITVPAGLKAGQSAPVVVTAADGESATYAHFTIQGPPTPRISTVAPNSASPGTMIRLYGMNFGSTPGSVTIGGVSAPIDQWTPYYLAVTVPNGLAAGQAVPIVVTAADGQSATDTHFTVQGPLVPRISAVYPAVANPGTVVHLYGLNFGSAPGTVTIGGVPALVDQWSLYDIAVTVPADLKAGQNAPIVVTGSDGQSAEWAAFTVGSGE